MRKASDAQLERTVRDQPNSLSKTLKILASTLAVIGLAMLICSAVALLVERIEQGYDVVCGWRKNRQDAWFSRTLPSRSST